MAEAFVYDHVRTPRGKGKAVGTLHEVKPVDLVVGLLDEVRTRNPSLDPAAVDDVVLGVVTPIGDQGGDIAKTAALAAGYPETVAGVQLNRFCASGLEAVNQAAQRVRSGFEELILAGGVESMSRVPMGSDGGAWAADPATALKTGFVPQGIGADLIATLGGWTRDHVDAYAAESHHRAAKAWANGYFAGSVVPVRDLNGLVVLDHDETVRPDTSPEGLAGLTPSFAQMGKDAGFDDVALEKYHWVERIDHVHHAGNSSGIVDGAAIMVIGSERAGADLGLTPRARVLATAVSGADPTIMLTGPAPASRKALAKAGLDVDDIDLFEINEAFAAVAMRFMRDLDISPEITNVNGGAIAMGHPLGATGAMILGTLIDELERRDLRRGLATLCVGGGMGIATIVELVCHRRGFETGWRPSSTTGDLKGDPQMTTTQTDVSAVRYERDDDGIVTLVLDDPTASANTMSVLYKDSMLAAVQRLYDEVDSDDGVTGVVVTSAKKTFFAGGDLRAMVTATKADAPAFFELCEEVKAGLRRLETFPRPVVAAINGAALGGGFEIALATNHRIAVDHPSVELGLPEATLGLLPGGGGVTRVVRMLGLQDGLMEVLLQGTRFKPAQAKEKGLVDELVGSLDDLVPAAKAWIKANPESTQNAWDRPGYKMPGGSPKSPALAQFLPAFPALLRQQVKGADYPAQKAILSAAVEGAQVDFDTATRIESRYLTNLIVNQQSKNMIQAFFFDLQAINAGKLRPQGVPTYRATKVGVLGAGMMGAGIAYVCAKAGMQVVLKDVAVESAEKGKAHSAGLLDKAIARGRSTEEKKAELLGRITATADPADLAGCDLVIEAVFEDPSLKHQVFAEIAGARQC